MLLFERELERALDDAERAAATSLCAGLEGHPVRILQAAALVRDHGISVDGCGRSITPATLIAELLVSIDEKQRRALLALTALPGVPLTAQHVSGIAELADIEPALRTLARRGLVGGRESRHRLADGVADQLRRAEDLTPWVNRAITYFTAWAERYRRSPGRLLEDSEALLAVQQYAADARRWAEVLRVGTLLEGALVTGARWGAWVICLERCLAAAKALGDRSAEAWALHEIGTRALCVGDPGTARRLLSQAVALRESIDDIPAAASSRQNLALVLAPAVDESRDPMPFSDVTDGDSFALRGATWSPVHAPAKRSGRAVFALQMVLVAGLAFFATVAALGGSGELARIGSFLRSAPGNQRSPTRPLHHPSRRRLTCTTRLPRLARATRCRHRRHPAQIPSARVFASSLRGPARSRQADPRGSATPSAARCGHALNPASARSPPASTLTCIRVTPARTTTYALDVYGRDGYPVRQQLVIVVR